MKVLIVEDQFLIAEEMSRAVSSLGGLPVGPCANVDAAREVLRTDRPDLALLDVHLRGENVFAFAADLKRLKVPFAFATGYDSEMIPEEFRASPRMEKPVSPTALQELIASLKKG